MENKASFFARLETRLAPSDLVRVRGAYYLAKFGHRAQVRKELGEDGNPLRYFEHVRRVALVLMDEAKVYDPDLICTALLHDTLEDTEDIDAHIIEQFFGANVARRVRLLTKAKDDYVARLQSADHGTILVKMCDRLDNIRSLDGTTEEFKARQLKETWDKYMPIFSLASGSGTPAKPVFINLLTALEKYVSQRTGKPSLTP